MPLPKRDTNPASNWVEKAGGLPPFLEDIADNLFKKHGDVGRAIAEAKETLERWAKGGTVRKNGGPKVKPDTIAKSKKALAEWEAKRKAGSKDLGQELTDKDYILHLAMKVEMADEPDFDMGAFELALAVERRERGLDMGAPVFRESAHRRDWKGRFAKKLMAVKARIAADLEGIEPGRDEDRFYERVDERVQEALAEARKVDPEGEVVDRIDATTGEVLLPDGATIYIEPSGVRVEEAPADLRDAKIDAIADEVVPEPGDDTLTDEEWEREDSRLTNPVTGDSTHQGFPVRGGVPVAENLPESGVAVQRFADPATDIQAKGLDQAIDEASVHFKNARAMVTQGDDGALVVTASGNPRRSPGSTVGVWFVYPGGAVERDQ